MANAYPIVYMIMVLFIFIILFIFSVLAIVNLLKSNTQNADISAAKSVLVGILIFQLIALLLFMAMIYFYSTSRETVPSVYKYINVWYIIIFVYAALFLFIAYKLNCYRKESQVNYNAWRWTGLSAILCFIGLIIIMSIKIFEKKEDIGCVKAIKEKKEAEDKLKIESKDKQKALSDLDNYKFKSKSCEEENKQLSQQSTCYTCFGQKGDQFNVGTCPYPQLQRGQRRGEGAFTRWGLGRGTS